MKEKPDRFYLVGESVLPQVLKGTARAKEMLKKGEAGTVNEAVRAVGISRSAFYKYRHYIFPFHEAGRGKILTVALILEHKAGVLSEVLHGIAAARGNVLTINQGIPLQGVANASISFETEKLSEETEPLLRRLAGIEGVQKLELVGHS